MFASMPLLLHLSINHASKSTPSYVIWTDRPEVQSAETAIDTSL